MKYLTLALLFALLPALATHGDESVASILPRRAVSVAVPVTAACPGGAVCPIAAPTLAPTVPLPAPALSPAKAPSAPKPFPGPSLNPPRVLWVWDNGTVFDSSAGVWRWQNDDGTWQQK